MIPFTHLKGEEVAELLRFFQNHKLMAARNIGHDEPVLGSLSCLNRCSELVQALGTGRGVSRAQTVPTWSGGSGFSTLGKADQDSQEPLQRHGGRGVQDHFIHYRSGNVVMVSVSLH